MRQFLYAVMGRRISLTLLVDDPHPAVHPVDVLRPERIDHCL